MEQKTFGELTIGDRFYVFCKSNGNYFRLISGELKKSNNKRNHIEVKDDDGDTTELPCDETRYEDEHYIYTMDGREFDKWEIPRWENSIKSREESINQLKSEIEELQKYIDKAKSNSTV